MMENNKEKTVTGCEFKISGVSYIGKPRSNTAMYISKKIENLAENLYTVTECMVYAEQGICIPDELRKNHCIIVSDNPQREYINFIRDFAKKNREEERKKRYTLKEEGYYVGENVQIGENAYIEPGCLIGHDVVIGKNARILAGVKIKNAVIGDNFVANENAVIGSDSFTMSEDRDGKKIRIPAFGKVLIGENVEVGAGNNIARGSNSDTVIKDNVKLDALIYIGHDVCLDSNVEITAGVIIGGFAEIKENVFIGFNSGLKNRVKVDKNSYIGMGANVIRNVEKGKTVAGNPARVLEK